MRHKSYPGELIKVGSASGYAPFTVSLSQGVKYSVVFSNGSRSAAATATGKSTNVQAKKKVSDLIIGAITKTVTLPYEAQFKPTVGNYYQFDVSGGTLSVGGNEKPSSFAGAYSTPKEGSYYALKIAGSGQATFKITAGGTASTTSVLLPLSQYQLDRWHENYNFIFNTSKLEGAIVPQFKNAIAEVNAQMKTNMGTSTSSGIALKNLEDDSSTAVLGRAHQSYYEAGSNEKWKVAATNSANTYIEFNTKKLGNNETTKWVAVHEIGHMLGLKDLDDSPGNGIAYSNWIMFGKEHGFKSKEFTATEKAAFNERRNSDNKIRSGASIVDNYIDTREIGSVLITTYYPLVDLNVAVDEAKSIVVGDVIAISDTQRVGDDVFRIATITVRENIKGIEEETKQVRMYGGTYDGVYYEYLDAKDYEIGDTVVLILKAAVNYEDREVNYDSSQYQVICEEFGYQINDREVSERNSIIGSIKANLR